MHIMKGNMWMVVGVMWLVVGLAGGLDIVPTGVISPQERTNPPTEVSRPQYVQTLYKATDSVIVMNTLEPLWPSYKVEYQDRHTTTMNNQTIDTSTAEFATVLNTTVEYYSDLTATNTLDVAATTFQTMEFQHQTVLYTDRDNKTFTTIENNDLPLI
ncbi:hypothetical protein Hamer_G005816 [Homarus americanus]|uniref:Uncharacterized protein n=1 Tax=Homarus americanus TaxID=6706 RepID=A0A8J5JMV7_HOMAM|nr:hypothetical protein Hamer_G005816 [Homarus americanus]